MDIRKFFAGTNKRNSAIEEVLSSEPSVPAITLLPAADASIPEHDLGKWIGLSSTLSPSQKKNILANCWTPPPSYDFRADAVDPSRKFQHKWLQFYAPWLAYSAKVKGALCLYCVLFPPKIHPGVLGSLILKPFTRYKHLHDTCKSHSTTQWHKAATEDAFICLNALPIDCAIVTGHKKIIAQNRKIIASMTSAILFCATHDLPLLGKTNASGVFVDLIQLCCKSGNMELDNHLENAKKNASYTSPRIQNNLIAICGEIVKNNIVNDIKKSQAYSILADESADISSKEQLSIGVRFFDEEKMIIREEFLGFVELSALDAQTVAIEIDKFIASTELDKNKCVGQGYDGCSTMAGKVGGVQNILRDQYKKALYFHCASHKLNLVVNDLNSVPEIRNTISTVKDIIRFFRESVLRRKYVPNISMLCETRYSQKYKSISLFKKHFETIIFALKELSENGNNIQTRKLAFQLHAAATKSIFVICVVIIAEYSAILEL